MASKVNWRGMVYAKGDMLVEIPLKLARMCGAIQYTQDSRIALVVEHLSVSSELSDGFAVASGSSIVEGWRLEDMEVRQAFCWHENSDGSLTVCVSVCEKL